MSYVRLSDVPGDDYGCPPGSTVNKGGCIWSCDTTCPGCGRRTPIRTRCLYCGAALPFTREQVLGLGQADQAQAVAVATPAPRRGFLDRAVQWAKDASWGEALLTGAAVGAVAALATRVIRGKRGPDGRIFVRVGGDPDFSDWDR